MIHPQLAEHIRQTTLPRGSFKAMHKARAFGTWADKWVTAGIVVMGLIGFAIAAGWELIAKATGQ